tara:strand:- start:365 stop:817 length:453 start_codon:yes stop_codon:yes gene_type:complete
MIEGLLTAEFLSLVGGSITGFIFKSLAEKRQNEQERFNRLLDANKANNESHNQAIQRVGSDAGKVVRRFIVLCILFGTIIAPFILPFFSVPTVVELVENKPHFLDFFGLFGTYEDTTFVPVDGYLFTTENRQILVTIVGFYFGSAVGKTR